jgi:hypothetical protein
MSHQLVTSKAIYITDFALLRTLNQNCINYSNAKGSATIVGSRLIATTDDGKSVTWDANNIRTESEKLFKMQFMTMSENGELHEKLRYLNIELQGFTGIDRAGALNLNQVNGQKVIVIKNKSGPIKCGVTDLYNHNVLLPNGDILLCCMDYDKKHVLGNLFNTPYYEIFRQDPFRDLIVENMNHLGASDKSICRKCDNAFKPHETM